MGVWARMSQAAHAVSTSLEGPYKRVGLAVPTQTHNTYYAYSPTDQMHLLYGIFDGKSPESCNPYFKCTNGSTPGHGPGVRPQNWEPKPTCPSVGGAHLHYSPSLDGPWKSFGGRLPVDTAGCAACGSSNPAPWIFANGTVLMVGRGKDTSNGRHNLWLYRAASWNSTYHWVPSNGVNGSLNTGDGKLTTEDPTLWRGRRGFHLLLHSHPDLTHAWSKDGLWWNWSATVIGPAEQPGGDNERPRVALDTEGDIAAVFVAQLVESQTDASRTAAFVPN